MKIGIYDPYLDDCGGGEKYMLTIAECLSQDNKVYIFWDCKEDLLFAKKRFGLKLSSVELLPDVFKKNILTKLWVTRDFDAIVFLSDGSLPFVLSRNLFLHVQRPLGSVGGGVKKSIKMLRTKKIFVNSKFTKDYIDSELKTDSKIIYPPVNLKPKNIKKENIILHVGRFRVTDRTIGRVNDYKKQNTMVDVFKKMSNKLSSDWRFILAVSVKAEDNESFAKLKNKTKGFPIEFVVNNTNDELWDLYSKSKIYWHASGFGEDLKSNPEFAEHFGISTVEAMGAGCVPVVINAGGQKEIVEDNVNGLLWNSLSEFEDKTLTLINDGRLLEKLSGEARKKSKVYSPEKFCREVKEMIAG